MKIEAVIHPQIKRNDCRKKDKNAIQLRILTGVYAAGIVFGVIVYLVRRPLMIDHLLDAATRFIMYNQDEPFAKLLLGYIAADMLLVAILFCVGSSVFGKRINYPIGFLKTAGVSVQACLIIQNHQPQGIGTYFLCVFPGKCILLLALLIMGQNCLYTSEEIKNRVSERGSASKRTLTLYGYRTAAVCYILLFADLLNAGLPMLFGHFPVSVS